MKKLLLGTSALFGALVFADAASAQAVNTRQPFTLSINGTFTSVMGVNSGDSVGLTTAGTATTRATTQKTYDALHESHLQFQLTARADNGLTYGGLVRYTNATTEPQPSSFTTRSWIYAQGSFGRVDFGDAGSARGLAARVLGVNSVGPGFGNGLGPDGGLPAKWYNTSASGGVTPQLAAMTTIGTLATVGRQSTSQRTKFTYTTPRWSGLQGGFSYTPTGGDAGSVITRGTSSTFGTTNTIANGARGNFRDVFEIGANYEAKFGEFTIIPGIGGAFAKANTPTTLGQGVNDSATFFAGLRGDYMGFSLGGGFHHVGKAGYVKGPANSDSTYGATVAAGYTNGPWAISAYFQRVVAEGDQATPANLELSLYEVAAGYNIAPGLQVYTAVHHYDYKHDDATRQKRNGTIFLVGTALTF
jgi:hypothetical protein